MVYIMYMIWLQALPTHGLRGVPDWSEFIAYVYRGGY